MHGEIRTVSPRPLNQPAAVDACGDEFGRVLLDGRHDDDHVAHERCGNITRREFRRTDLDIHVRTKLVDERRLAQQRFDLRSEPRSTPRSRPARARVSSSATGARQNAPQPPAPEVHRLPDIERAAALREEHIDAGRRRAPRIRRFADFAPWLASISTTSLRDEAAWQRGGRVPNAEDVVTRRG